MTSGPTRAPVDREFAPRAQHRGRAAEAEEAEESKTPVGVKMSRARTRASRWWWWSPALLWLLLAGAAVRAEPGNLLVPANASSDQSKPRLLADYSVSADEPDDEAAERLLWRRQVEAPGDDYYSGAESLVPSRRQDPALLEQQEPQGQQKVGPQFVREPPSSIQYTNSSDLVIPCAASGHPAPTISWWHGDAQLEVGSLLDRRYVRYDNALVISAFKEHEFEPEIHATVYKCQAANPFGSIVSRDVVISAVLEQEQEVSVGDQFVTADNDALFKCQFAPQSRELLQLVGWLEDNQPLVAGKRNASAKTPRTQRALLLPDGQLLVQRAQLRDANRSYKCQFRNALTNRLGTSAVGGRLFVTDAGESGAAPRVVEPPRAISVARLGEPLLLTCLAQGSPRPTVRWFRQQPATSPAQSGSEWAELAAGQAEVAEAAALVAEASAPQQSGTGARYMVSSEANLLLIRSLQAADNRIRFKCLANNTYGMQFAETELRVEMWPADKLVELEPKLEFIDNNSLQQPQQQVQFNCTLRQSPADPLIGVEWLRNGKLLLGLVLPSYVQSLYYQQQQSAQLSSLLAATNLSAGQLLAAGSLFDELGGELSAVESVQPAPEDRDELRGAYEPPSSHEQPSLVVSQTSVQKLGAQAGDQSAMKHRGQPRARQRLRALAKDQLLYQLQLEQVRRADRGAYQCRARSLQTTLQATGHLMLKDNPPKFVDTFADQLVASSHPAQVSLKCVASGSPLPEISWTLSGFPVPESSRFRVGDYVTRDGLIVSFVNITNVQPEDGGLYECSAANDVGHLRHGAWLNVTGALVVRPMAQVNAIAGSALSIMCPVGGWPIEQISWFQNSSKLPLNHRQKLFPNGTLLISELNEVADAGRYSCQAKSSLSDSVATNHVQISIRVPPVVEPFAFARSLHRGQRYNVMCTVVRGDLPVRIRWFKDGRLVGQPSGELPAVGGSGGGGGIAVKQLDPYSSTLTFGSLQAHHRGQYSCEATNEAGSANQSSSLVIHVPPEWRVEPRDTSVIVGRTAVIDCQADAFPSARIEWRLSQDLFREPPTEFKPITSSLYMRVFENGSLVIYNSQRADAGYYLCQASNSVGPGLSRVVKLTVNVAAHFKSKIRTELVRRGQPVRLRCEALGDPPVDISWLKDKVPLYAADYEPRYAITKSALADGCSSELAIAESERADSALFTCIAQNQFGTDDTNVQLVVQSVPDPPLDIRIHEYEARSVKISWLLGHTGNAPISRFVISYAQTADSPAAPSSWLNMVYTNVTVAGNESSLLLQGLTPLTEYQFYMVAVNSLGASRLPSEPIKFRTDDEAPNAPPVLVKAQPVSSKSIRVRWRAPERRAHFGSLSGFYVGYKLHLDSPGADSATPASAGDTFIYKTVEFEQSAGQIPGADRNASSGNFEFECHITDLRRSHKYLITVQAFNSRGAGPVSEPIIAETWRIDVPEAPSLRMVARTSRSIHLAWRLAASPSTATVEGQQQSLVRLRHAPKLNSRQFSPEVLELIQLSESLPAQVGASPSTVQPGNQLDAIERQAEEAQANEPILGFVLTRKSVGSPGPGEQMQPPVEVRLPSEHMSHIVDNLICGTRYQFTIAALNSVGASPPSEPLIVKTEGTTPVAPDKSSLLSLNSSSVVINLAAWHNGACPMRSFDILFKPSRAKKWTPLTNYQVSAEQTPMNASSGSQLAQRSTYSQQQQVVAAGVSSHINSTIVLDELSAALDYDLKILATNEAGSTEALYTFNTKGGQFGGGAQWGGMQNGDFQLQDANLSELLAGSSPVLHWLLFSLLVCLILSTGCFLVVRRRHLASSRCSLSLSSASRSNQSSSNYYSSSGDHNQRLGSAPAHKLTTATLKRREHPFIGEGEASPNPILQMAPSDIYGHAHPQHSHGASNTMDKSNYACLSGHRRPMRADSPHDNELASVMNGGGSSEAEMCLGASALDLAMVDERRCRANGKGTNQSFYMAPLLHQIVGKQQNLNKSCTLPSDCQQQIMQQMIQQQHQLGGTSSDQRELIDSLVANASLQMQQQQQAATDTYLASCIQANATAAAVAAAAAAAAVSQQQQSSGGIDTNGAATANLWEHQLQHQVYATVKRGCPRPPRLCDYTLYQCPGAQTHVSAQLQQGQQQYLQQQLPLELGCCDTGATLDHTTSTNNHLETYATQINQSEQISCNANQQQQQHHHHLGDYQQLRPI